MQEPAQRSVRAQLVLQMISCRIESTHADPTAAKVYIVKPAKRIGLRPNRSDIGPQINCEIPKESKSADSIYCACAIVAPKPSEMAGRAGKYKSVVTGWMPMSRARMKTTVVWDRQINNGLGRFEPSRSLFTHYWSISSTN